MGKGGIGIGKGGDEGGDVSLGFRNLGEGGA